MDRLASYAMDRARIAATVRAYATGVDLRDFDLLSRVFAGTIEVDFTSWEPTRSAMTLSYDQWAAGVRPQLLGLDSTLHTIRDPRITIEGAEAVSVARMQAEHYLLSDPAETSFTVTGHYTDRLVRSGDGWRITAKKLIVTREEGNRNIMVAAKERGLQLIGF